jgi:hypothetical protein
MKVEENGAPGYGTEQAAATTAEERETRNPS